MNKPPPQPWTQFQCELEVLNHVLFERVTIFIISKYQISGSLLYFIEPLSQLWTADTSLSLGEGGKEVIIILVPLQQQRQDKFTSAYDSSPYIIFAWSGGGRGLGSHSLLKRKVAHVKWFLGVRSSCSTVSVNPQSVVQPLPQPQSEPSLGISKSWLCLCPCLHLPFSPCLLFQFNQLQIWYRRVTSVFQLSGCAVALLRRLNQAWCSLTGWTFVIELYLLSVCLFSQGGCNYLL